MPNLSTITTYQAGVYQSRAFRELQQLTTRILKPYGITMAQWSLLGFVNDAGSDGIRSTELAIKLDTTQAFVTNTVNLLVKKGYVKRRDDISDSRARDIILNTKHIELVQKIEQAVRVALRREIYSKVTADELNTYVNVLIKFAEKS